MKKLGTRSNDNLLHHSIKLDYSALKELERLAKERAPKIYNKYLKRYEITEDQYQNAINNS